MGHKAGTLTTHTAGQVGQFIIGGWVNFGPVVTPNAKSGGSTSFQLLSCMMPDSVVLSIMNHHTILPFKVGIVGYFSPTTYLLLDKFYPPNLKVPPSCLSVHTN